jgi:beta-lactamase regulating signal transducer with metallopeptidase domain
MRHWILAAALACAAVAPALERLMPSWELPSTSSLRQAVVVAQSFSPADTVRSPEALRHVPSREPARAVVGTFDVAFVRRVYLAGVAVSVLALLVGLARLTWIVSRASELRDGAWVRIADEVSREYGLRRRVRLLQSAHPTLLATWGWVRPRVLLPAGAHGWSVDRIRIVLLHEIAHVVRNDWATQVFAEIVRSVYWFNPFVWIAGRRLRQESERAADDAVLNRGIDGAAYATELLTLARSFGPYGRVWAPAPGIVRASSLERRVSAMLSPTMNRRSPSRASRLATAVALFVAAVAIASAQGAFSSFSGAVYDPLNGLLPNVRMMLTNEQTRREVRDSFRLGRPFQFVGLPPGRYTSETELWGSRHFAARSTSADRACSGMSGWKSDRSRRPCRCDSRIPSSPLHRWLAAGSRSCGRASTPAGVPPRRPPAASVAISAAAKLVHCGARHIRPVWREQAVRRGRASTRCIEAAGTIREVRTVSSDRSRVSSPRRPKPSGNGSSARRSSIAFRSKSR